MRPPITEGIDALLFPEAAPADPVKTLAETVTTRDLERLAFAPHLQEQVTDRWHAARAGNLPTISAINALKLLGFIRDGVIGPASSLSKGLDL